MLLCTPSPNILLPLQQILWSKIALSPCAFSLIKWIPIHWWLSTFFLVILMTFGHTSLVKTLLPDPIVLTSSREFSLCITSGPELFICPEDTSAAFHIGPFAFHNLCALPRETAYSFSEHSEENCMWWSAFWELTFRKKCWIFPHIWLTAGCAYESVRRGDTLPESDPLTALSDASGD